MSGSDRPFPVWIQVLSGVGGILLVVGMALVGVAYLEEGVWSSFTDAPAQMAVAGLLILAGVAVRNAIRADRADEPGRGEERRP